MARPPIPYDGPIVTRTQAMALGLKRFYTGKFCKRGHLAERMLPSSDCVDCAKMTQAARYLACSDEYKARSRARYAAKRDHCRAISRAYYILNCEAIRAATAEYQRQNPEKARAWRKAWDKDHPEVRRAIKANRRARERYNGGSIKALEIAALLAAQRFKCAGCRVSIRKKYHLDHIMPLALGGENAARNIQALCPLCNWRKNAKHPVDWAQENGRLL